MNVTKIEVKNAIENSQGDSPTKSSNPALLENKKTITEVGMK